MPKTPFTVMIIGAGTGGMCLAHGLRRAGIEVAVYERDRTRTGGLQGYRVGISPNGCRALKSCLDQELFDTFVATTGKPPQSMNMYTEKFAELVSMGAAEFSGHEEKAPEDKDYSVSRMTMRQVLFTGMEDVIHFDKKFTHYVTNVDGKVTAHFADGTTATADLLVGADGANSPVRKQYLPHATHTETGLIGISGKLPLTPETRKLLPPKASTGLSMVFDKRGSFAILHVMEFPWRPTESPQDGALEGRALKDGIGGTDAALIERWPGLLFDNTTDYLMFGLSVSRSLLPDDVLSLGGAELQRAALALTQDWDPRLRTMIGQADPTSTFALSIRTSDPVPAWQPSTVTLIGDAIHTMTPGRGAGANTALRDAQLLRDNLIGVRDGRRGLTEAVGDYEAKMRAYSAQAVKESLQFMNDNGTARKPVIGPLSTFATRSLLRVTNRVPALKRKMANGFQRVRDSERV